jgi:hypothetical protein
MELIINEKTQFYFKVWENKNINELENLFNSNIILKDWTNKWIGKFNVIEANKEIFKNDIKVSIVKIDVIYNISYCQLELNVNGEILYVMDVIEFDDDFLIKSITAYRG